MKPEKELTDKDKFIEFTVIAAITLLIFGCYIKILFL